MVGYTDGAPIGADEAWGILERWTKTKCGVGVIFWGRSGNIYTNAAVHSARNGRVELAGDSCRASFNLVGASFRYGPMQLWPRWPSPQTVEGLLCALSSTILTILHLQKACPKGSPPRWTLLTRGLAAPAGS
jgi:hypothetical protein